jgi:hypothetical protein
VAALVQVAVEPGQGAWLVPVQPEAVFQGGDQRGSLLAGAGRAGADDAEPPGDLLPAGS